MINSFSLLAAGSASTAHPALLSGSGPLLLLAILIVIGTFAGNIASKFHFPALTGQIIAGILIGPSVPNLMGVGEEQIMTPLTNFAIGLIAVTVGAHLNFRRMHNSYGRILQIALVEASLAFVAVFCVFQYFNPFNLTEQYQLAAHLLIASIATATSPASALHIIKEKQAKGLLVKTMIAVIAIDNLICLAVFEIVRAVAKQQISGTDFLETLLPGLVSFAIAIAIGALVGWVLSRYCVRIQKKNRKEHAHGHGQHALNSTLFAIMLTSIGAAHGLCQYTTELFGESSFPLTPSPLMACMILGLVLANTTKLKDDLLKQFDIMEKAVFTCFFTLAGMHLNVQSINESLLKAAGLYLLAMGCGKFFGAFFAAAIGSSTKKIAKYIGRVLLVQAGMSIALVIVIGKEPMFAEFSETFIATLLTCVVATELIGTVLISITLDHAKESNQDRTRLIDFLDEEFIIPRIYAKNSSQAIEQLCHFMVSTHKMDVSTEELYEKVIEREELMPTGIGEGIAVPHAMIETDDSAEIKGVLALAHPAVDFGAPDNKPARLIILIITPKNHHDRHLQVIAAIAKMVQQENIRDAIMNSRSAAEIYEIINSEEAETFNYFLNS